MTQKEMLSQMESMLQPLQQVNASQAETIKKLTEQNESLQSRIKELTAQVAWLNRQLFGRKSEKLPIIDPNYPVNFQDRSAISWEGKQALSPQDSDVLGA